MALTLNRIQRGAPIWARLASGGPRNGPDEEPDEEPPIRRLSWDEICRRSDCQGRWVALSECRYDSSGKAIEGLLVDADDDLPELCDRVRERSAPCDIVFCVA